MRKREAARWCCRLPPAHPPPQAAPKHAKPQGPTWYRCNDPKCALTFHYTLAITMCADYKYQSLSFPYTDAAPQHSAVKTQHSSSFRHAAHAGKTTEGELFVTLQGANSV